MERSSQPSLQAVAGAIWDLRDRACDHPEQWDSVRAESIFQVMAEIIERAIDAEEGVEWTTFPLLVHDTLIDRPDFGHPVSIQR